MASQSVQLASKSSVVPPSEYGTTCSSRRPSIPPSHPQYMQTPPPLTGCFLPATFSVCMVSSVSGRDPRNRADANTVALGKAARRLALGDALPRLLDLVRRQFRLAAHTHPLCTRELPSFMRALDDAQAFIFRHCGHHRHEAATHRCG